jgi:hypothetical protein
MPADNTQAPQVRFPSRTAPDRDTAERHLALLTNWRTGALATAVATAGLLPFAIAWQDSDAVAIAAAIIIAAILVLGIHVARRRRLATIALSPELAGLAELAAERRRLQSARTRHALAAGLRRAADPIQPPRRFDPCPVLTDRVAVLRDELLALANALEQTQAPDPASVALLRELLTNGTSPLYNPNLPAADLHATLTRATAALTPQPHPNPASTTTSRPPRVASSQRSRCPRPACVHLLLAKNESTDLTTTTGRTAERSRRSRGSFRRGPKPWHTRHGSA